MIWNSELKLTVEVVTREMFNDFLNLWIFLLCFISIINRLISDDGDFVCYRLVSEMQHALETRLPFYKWRYVYLLNLCDHMTMMKAIPLKVECSNKISPLVHPYFSTIQTPLTLLLNCNLILPIIWMSFNYFSSRP